MKLNKQANKEYKSSTNFLDGYESTEVLMVIEKECLEEWVMDSGCAFYMTPCKQFFTDLNELEGGRVYMGNN